VNICKNRKSLESFGASLNSVTNDSQKQGPWKHKTGHTVRVMKLHLIRGGVSWEKWAYYFDLKSLSSGG